MSSDGLALAVSGLSKSYTIAHQAGRPTTLAEKLVQVARGLPVGARETFSALSDVSFEVARGEVLGIIGPNGAGKSTLLKILSGITDPTSGEGRVWGRVGSLLEVGTGFHPELTGRENIYLNGCILGMRKADVDRRFAEIVAFSGVERFLDTPTKRYSSGMLVRLGFAVAAHLEPDILIVDEVLAVGDAEFQTRCLGKLRDVAGGGRRTVLFVSHNLQAVRALCSRAIVLRQGRVIADGPVEEAAQAYLGAEQELEDGGVTTFRRPSGVSPWMVEARLEVDGVPSGLVAMGSSLRIVIHYRSAMPVRNPLVGFAVTATSGAEILSASNSFQPTLETRDTPTASGAICCDLGTVPLVPGTYWISLWVGDDLAQSHVAEHAVGFRVLELDLWGLGRLPPSRQSSLWWPTKFSIVDEYRPPDDETTAQKPLSDGQSSSMRRRP